MRPLKVLISKSTIHRAHVDTGWPNPYGLTEKDAKGRLEDWPLEIITLALYESILFRGKYSLKDLQGAGIIGAFQWDLTLDGSNFWRDIRDGKFDVFYNRYTPEKLKERLEE